MKQYLMLMFASLLTLSGCLSSAEEWPETVMPIKTLPAADIVIDQDATLPMAQRGGDFTLYGHKGAVALSDFKGKVVAIYFGYSRCPDVCPTSLALLSTAIKQLSEHELAQFQSVFISVDPGRDSPELLAQYAAHFDSNMIAISGAPADLNPVVEQYGAYYEKTAYSNSAMLYGIAHTSEIYIVDRSGAMAVILPHASPPDTILAAIREAMEK